MLMGLPCRLNTYTYASQYVLNRLFAYSFSCSEAAAALALAASNWDQ